MLGLDQRAARAAWTVMIVILAVAIVYIIRRTLMLFVLALLLAHLLSPVVDLIARHTPRRVSRNLALGIVYVALLAILVSVSIGIGFQVVNQATNLAAKVPYWLKPDTAETAMPIPAWLDPIRAHVLDWLRQQTANLSSQTMPFLQNAGKDILSGIGSLATLILIPILSFFFLKDAPAIKETILSLFDTNGRRAVVEDIFADVHLMLAQYIRALVLLAGATFCFYALFLQVTGAPYALLLAGIAALLEVIPAVGPLAAAIIIMIVTALSGYHHLLWLLIFLVLYRLFQDYVLSPYLMGTGVEIHPLLILFGVLAGEQVGGIPGMFFSVPVMATLRVVLVRLARERDRERLRAETS